MDYKAFFAEVVEWISLVNQNAMKYGMDSDEFWQWVTKSMGEIGNKFNNNNLVVRQMAMLFEWLEDVYAEGRKGK